MFGRVKKTEGVSSDGTGNIGVVSQDKNGASGSSRIGKNGARIVRVEPRKQAVDSIPAETPQGNAGSVQPIDANELANRAKSFRPFIEQMLGIVVGVGNQIVTKAANGLADQKQVEKIIEAAEPPKERREFAALCGGRILARRVENPDIVDAFGLASFGAEYMAGLFIAVSELKKISATEQAKKQEEKARGKNPESQTVDGKPLAQ